MSGMHTPGLEAEVDAATILKQRDDAYRGTLRQIGQAIGFGNAQHILGELWDEMLTSAYGISGRGRMGVTVDDDLPPIPKPRALRRKARPDGGYEMVPAYSRDELKAFARAAITRAQQEQQHG